MYISVHVVGVVFSVVFKCEVLLNAFFSPLSCLFFLVLRTVPYATDLIRFLLWKEEGQVILPLSLHLPKLSHVGVRKGIGVKILERRGRIGLLKHWVFLS